MVAELRDMLSNHLISPELVLFPDYEFRTSLGTSLLLDNSQTFVLSEIVECDYIPQNRIEIPIPEVAEHYPHLTEIAARIQPLDNTIDIELLIGRDLLDVHVILDQRVGNSGEPFAVNTFRLSSEW